MISLTRLSGSEFVLNSDLIERIDATPDTVVTLVDGKKYVVSERPAAIVRSVREHRACIIALSAEVPTAAHDLTPEDEGEREHRLAPVSALRVKRDREA